MSEQEPKAPLEHQRSQLVVFALGEQRYALHLSAVERILRMVEVTPLPKAPEIVLGIINVRGRVVPVVDIRKRFGLPEQEVNLGDQLILAHTTKRAVAFMVDSAGGVVERPNEEVAVAATILPNLKYVQGVARLEDGLILIHDLDTFLSLEEENTLQEVLKPT